MEWMNRGQRPGQPAASQHPVAATSPAVSNAAPQQTKNGKRPAASQVSRWASIVLLFSVTILLIALVGSIVVGNKGQERYVDKKNLQAVFLNGGQVYFGKIGDLNSKYLSLSNIYYLRVNQQVQPNQTSTSTNANDIQLVKLGCELHGPQDRMVINQDQVIFWENLKPDGQVAKAVNDYVQQSKTNPNSQQCSQQTGSTDGSNAATTNPAPTATTPATTPSSGSSKSVTPSTKK